MQINLDANKLVTGALSTVLIGGFTFLWTVNNRVTALEQSKNLAERVEKLENALLPVLVEYKMQQEIKKLGLNSTATPPPPPTSPTYTDPSYSSFNEETIRNQAENWAKEQIPNVSQQPINGNSK